MCVGPSDLQLPIFTDLHRITLFVPCFKAQPTKEASVDPEPGSLVQAALVESSKESQTSRNFCYYSSYLLLVAMASNLLVMASTRSSVLLERFFGPVFFGARI